MVKAEKPAVIQTAGLTKTFRDFWGHTRVTAVDELDLEVYQGEVFGLLGPNGSGKSTTIKMLLGLLFPTQGVARVLGKPPGDVKTNHRIGFLPEESYLYAYLNARETLDFYGRLFGLSGPERRRRIDSLLDMVGLAGAARRPVGEYSKGMARRIGLAQALINDPDLLILDEPTSGLDPLGTRQIKDLICQLGERGKTVLLCSHLLADVEDVCDRIGILYGGKLRELGTMNELLCRHDTTQIRCKRLSPAAIEKIKSAIQDDRIEVEAPRERLEDYFMRIVSEAQADQAETSHAMIGSGISDFLSRSGRESPDEAGVIDQLVTADKPKTPEPAATTTTAELFEHQEEPHRDMLDSLVGTPSNPSEPLTVSVDPSGDESSQEQPGDAVDHGVLDELTAKSRGAPTGPQKGPSSSQQDTSTDPTKQSGDALAERNDE